MIEEIVRKFIRRNYVIVEFWRIFRETMEFVDEKLGQQFNALSWYLHQPESHQLSLQQGVSVSYRDSDP